MNAFTWIEHCSKLPDYRQLGKVEYKLADILLLVVCAMIIGAKGWKEIKDFGNHREKWLQKLGSFSSGILSHDTIERVISLVSAKKFHQYFSEWMQEYHEATDGAVIARLKRFSLISQ